MIGFLDRENNSEPWGFRLSGGKDQGQPLQISQVGHLFVFAFKTFIFTLTTYFNARESNQNLVLCPGCEGQPDPEGWFASQ